MRCEATGCTRDAAPGKTTCYPHHLTSIGFTYRGPHMGRASWNDTTVEAERRAIFDNAKANGWEHIEKAR